MRFSGIGRVRARKLFNNGIKDIGDVKRCDIGTLTALLGKALEADIKKQVGQELPTPIPETKRKGQMGLSKY